MNLQVTPNTLNPKRKVGVLWFRGEGSRSTETPPKTPLMELVGSLIVQIRSMVGGSLGALGRIYGAVLRIWGLCSDVTGA